MRIELWFKRLDPATRSVSLAILLVLVVFLAANAMSEPLPSYAHGLLAVAPTETLAPTRATATSLPSATATIVLTPTRTPIPPELLENADATDGIIFGTVMLVAIVLAGTIAGINVRRKQHLDK